MDEGVTISVDPVPTCVPPHEPVYHVQFAPVPRLPPCTDKVSVIPWQIEAPFVLKMELAMVDAVLMLEIVTEQLAVHPFASVTVYVYVPGASPANEPVPLYGAVPPEALTLAEPSAEAGQEAF